MNKLLKTKKPKLSKKLYIHHIEPQVKLDNFEFYPLGKIHKIKNESLEEVIIQDALEYFNDSDAVMILNTIISKLENGGKLHIQGLDSKALCYGVVYSQVDISTFKVLVYGIGKTNIYTISQVKNLIASLSAHISINKIKFLNGLQYYIECIKQ